MSNLEPGSALPPELPVVAALRALSIFSADQAGAYREHFEPLAEVLGQDVETKLGRHVAQWALSGEPGALILTGNAGTGKTAVAEAYCRILGVQLPDVDHLIPVAEGRQVIKDLSGLPDRSARAAALSTALDSGNTQTLVCANEGVLRDGLDDIGRPEDIAVLEEALRQGAARLGVVTIVNVNRQRPTADGLWSQLIDYVTRKELWSGCRDCPFESGGCPMRSNAEQLRTNGVRTQLRTLVRLGTGEAVPTLREVLAILSWAIVGGQTCGHVKDQTRDRGHSVFTASAAYFSRVLGGGLDADAVERSPLLRGIRSSRLGDVSDLEVDGWLRDSSGAPRDVQALAGDPTVRPAAANPEHEGGVRERDLAGSQSPLDRVLTKQGPMTFHALGEMVSTDEDRIRVEDGLDALVSSDGPRNLAGQALWRQRVYFEAPEQLGRAGAAERRLLKYRHLPDLVDLARNAAAGGDAVIQLTELVCGLNFLVTGFSSPNEGLIVPDPACLFSRDPGSFRPARPSLVHSLIAPDRLTVAVPDRGLVEELLDVDHVDVELTVDGDPARTLRIGPRMYEAIREAAEFQGPVGQGVAEMNDLRGFYGRLASGDPADNSLRVADPESKPPALVKITLPHFAGRAGA